MKVRKCSEHEKGVSKGLRSSFKGPAGRLWDHLSFNINSMHAQSLSRVWLFVIPWTVARQAPLSMGFSRQEYWSGLPFPPPGVFSQPQDGTCVSCIGRWIFFFFFFLTTELLGNPLEADTHWLKQATMSSNWRTLNVDAELWRMDTCVVSRLNTYLWPREKAREGGIS